MCGGSLRSRMEEGLLVVKEKYQEGEKTSVSVSEEGGLVIRWGVLGEEIKRLGGIAAPMVVVTISQFLLQVVCTMMVGHLGELSLSSTAIATSLSAVTGYSLLVFSFPLSFSLCVFLFFICLYLNLQ